MMQAPADISITFSTIAHSIELGILALLGFLARQAWNDIRKTVHSAQQSIARMEDEVQRFVVETSERLARLEEGQKYFTSQLRRRL